MISVGPFSDAPFADIPEAARITPATSVFYLSTNGYTSASDDSVASQYFDARVTEALQFSRAVAFQDRVAGVARGSGEAMLANGDGVLDSLVSRYALEGRALVVRHGKASFAYDAFRTVFSGVMSGFIASRDDVRVSLRDALDKLDVPIQTTTYAGTGGKEGGDDLKGKPKPIALGKVFNVPALLLDAANEVYQVASHQVQAISAVRDRGVALAVATSGGPGLGEFETDLSDGTFELGDEPDGQVTVDLQGHADPTYATTTSALVQRVLEDYAGFAAGDLDLPSFAALASEASATVGLWIGPEQRTIADVIDELLAGIGAFAAVRRDGRIMVAQFKLPSGAPTDIGNDQILSVTRQSVRGAFYPPAWRQRVGWKRNYTVQDDIAGSVSDSVRTAVAVDYRIAAAADAAIQSAYPLSPDPDFVRGLFVNASDAETEASRLLTLYGTTRGLYDVTVGRIGFGLDINDVVRITHPALGLDAGKFGRVIGVRDSARQRTVTLTVFI